MAEHAAVVGAISAIERNQVAVMDSDTMSRTRRRSIENISINKPKKLIHFNISGQRFIVSNELAQKFPHSKLNDPEMLEEHWVADLGMFYLDRDPALFNTVLNIYRYGVLSIPAGYDRSLVIKEAEFWKVPTEHLSTGRDQAEDKLEAEFRWLENRIAPPPHNAKPWKQARYKAWCFITDPLGPHTPFRTLSIICCFATVALTIIYMILFGLSTSPYYRQPIMEISQDNREKANATYDMDLDAATAAIGCKAVSKIDCYLHSKVISSISFSLKAIMIMFIGETVLRLLFCPGCAYFKSLVTWMDILAGVCAIIVFILQAVLDTFSDDDLAEDSKKSLHLVIILMQSFQVLRIFKIFQYASVIDGLMIMVLTIKACLKELLLLVLYLLIAMFLFSTLIFFLEINSNTGAGIPYAVHGYWWSIITMTTVGYGDYYPTTTGGYFIGVMCSITGIILTALPVAVIGSNFSTYWEHNKKRRTALMAAIKENECKKESLISVNGFYNEL